MTRKIIKLNHKDKDKKERLYQRKCPYCGTKYIYQQEDITKVIYPYQDFYSKVVYCPNCDGQNTIHIKRRYIGKERV